MKNEKSKIKGILISELNICTKCVYFSLSARAQTNRTIQDDKVHLCALVPVPFCCYFVSFANRTIIHIRLVINGNIIHKNNNSQAKRPTNEPEFLNWQQVYCNWDRYVGSQSVSFWFCFRLYAQLKRIIIFKCFRNHAVCVRDIVWNQMVFPVPLNL